MHKIKRVLSGFFPLKIDYCFKVNVVLNGIAMEDKEYSA